MMGSRALSHPSLAVGCARRQVNQTASIDASTNTPLKWPAGHFGLGLSSTKGNFIPICGGGDLGGRRPRLDTPSPEKTKKAR
jgi:hypothetical protein